MSTRKKKLKKKKKKLKMKKKTKWNTPQGGIPMALEEKMIEEVKAGYDKKKCRKMSQKPKQLKLKLNKKNWQQSWQSQLYSTFKHSPEKVAARKQLFCKNRLMSTLDVFQN
ncbi:MAG: hypothetical protein CM15mV90_280 [uncultured marine virus]|nr:MAG: hypothetical protein CM15mV90_280 [uncultured marine virus]